MKYRLTKTQVKMLIDGKHIMNGRSKFYADGGALETLKLIDSKDAYNMFDILIIDGYLEIVEK